MANGKAWRGIGGMFWRLASVVVLALAFVSLPTRAALPAAPSGWTLRFGDDFSGAAGRPPDSAKWKIDEGHGYPGGPPNWGTNEIEVYTGRPENLQLDGHGHLAITPRRDPSGAWSSARIETRREDFQAPAGGVMRIEARIRMPDVTGNAALGYWPAFWALGQNYRRSGNWPQAGEFDIMENVNGIDSVWGILHCGVNPGGPCHEPNGLGRREQCKGSTCQTAFHVYRFEWDRSRTPGQLRWYVDGVLFNHVEQNDVPAATWTEITGHGYFLLLDVALGGGFSYAMAGGIPTPTALTEPGHPMLVDYVAVWTREGAAAH